MKVAIVGIGAVARYLIDELLSRKHHVVTISRSRKAWLDNLNVEQHQVQYTADMIAPLLQDCDAVICTISSSSPELVGVHESLLEACKSTPTCKRFIPSVWVGNFEDIRDQPYYGANRIQRIYDMLVGQQSIEWTLLSVGWLIDYVIPASQRYLPNERFWVQDVKDKTFKLYGNGTQTISCTAARDAASAVVRLLETDAGWEPFTYISGEQIKWFDLWRVIKEYDPEYRLAPKSLTESIKQLVNSTDGMATVDAVFDVMGHSEALCYPQERVDKHRHIYFEGIQFRSVRELIEDAKANPGRVI
uniref:NAD(P)-binding domain-containing protein n=1 Tax=Bionectria ochroleuca TaxID=29856 RepID=A0A8H7KBY5_BIOOC